MTRWNNHLKTIVLLGALSALLQRVRGARAPMLAAMAAGGSR